MWCRHRVTGATLPAGLGQALLGRIAGEEEGQTLVEYGVLVAVIAIVVLLVAILIGLDISASFERVLNYF